jgi:hypothetical protein
MKLFLILVLSLLGAIVGSCLGFAGEKNSVPVFSYDDTSCGAWVQSASDELGRAQYLSWFRGFVSGYNYGSEGKQVPLEAMPNQETVALFIDKYCREHPLSPFIGAAFELVKELREKKQ